MKKIVTLLFICFFLTSCSAVSKQNYSVSTGEALPIVREAKLAVVGDIMVHDYQYQEAYDPSTGTYDFMHNFQDVKKYFDGYDLVLGNLESTFGGTGRSYSSYPCFNTPDAFLDAVKDAGFDILTTANNHCMDTGKAGLIRTLDKLDEAGIAHMGTYRSAEDRDKILYQNVNGINFAFLSYTYGTNGIAVPDAYLVNLINEDQMVADIKKARERADVVVVMPHMGNEYETFPKEVFQKWADLMFLSGADVILASHPHVLQRMEYRKVDHGDGEHDGFIIYSLGNFISSQTTPPRNASIILHLTIEQLGDEPPNVKKVSFVPVWTQFRNAQDTNHFVVRSVYEMMTLDQNKKDQLIRRKDQRRLEEVHDETASFLLDRKIPISEIQEEYVFEK
ncbi:MULTISPECIES: CapA family protein [Anaerotignum]|uniref:CapA family protein n=1 Tax=Anaerotignum TaxID=2039240 RepID=UPI00210BA7C8|nr:MULTISPECIES: CapA family protein [Anaerotignum]MCQ4935399.1 CapA family protein [Anaerotignum propionicum]